MNIESHVKEIIMEYFQEQITGVLNDYVEEVKRCSPELLAPEEIIDELSNWDCVINTGKKLYQIKIQEL